MGSFALGGGGVGGGGDMGEKGTTAKEAIRCLHVCVYAGMCEVCDATGATGRSRGDVDVEGDVEMGVMEPNSINEPDVLLDERTVTVAWAPRADVHYSDSYLLHSCQAQER